MGICMGQDIIIIMKKKEKEYGTASSILNASIFYTSSVLMESLLMAFHPGRGPI